MEPSLMMKMSRIKDYGNRSEVLDPDGKVLFIGSNEACQNFCDQHDAVTFDENGTPVTRFLLRQWFNVVCNEKNWKSRIYKTLSSISEHERHLTTMAIEFFTGSQAQWTDVGNGEWRVEANGYYECVGA